MVVLIVRFMVSPHHKNDLEPLRSQSPERLSMRVSLRPLVPIIFVRPLTSIDRVKGKPVSGIPQQLVTRITKLYTTTLATLYRDRHCACLGLKVVKRNPSTLRITQLSPKRGYRRSTLAARQRLGQVSCRRRSEKTLDLLAVAIHRFTQSLKLTHQHRDARAGQSGSILCG